VLIAIGNVFTQQLQPLEVFTQARGRERRVAIAGPGELVGYMATLNGAPHGGNARVRESATLLEFPREALFEIYNGTSAASVSFQHAIQRSLLKSLSRTNTLAHSADQPRLPRENGRQGAGTRGRIDTERKFLVALK